MVIQNMSIVDKQVHVKLQGNIYLEEAAALKDTFADYIDRGHSKFLVDFSAVDYIDSTGLGTMVAVQKKALQKGGGVAITGLNGLVKDLFELTRLTRVFEMR